MNGQNDELRKSAYLYEISSGVTKEIVATITLPMAVGDKQDSHICHASVDTLFPARRKFTGVDALQAIFLATLFIEKLLSSKHHGFEIRNADGTRYESTLGGCPFAG